MQITVTGTTVSLQGAFDVRSTSAVREAISDVLASDSHGSAVVDLSEVHTVDVTALRLLAFATRRAARDGGHLLLRGCGPSVVRMLHISRLVRLVEIEREPLAA